MKPPSLVSLQRPGDAEFLLLGRRHRGEMGVAADDPARIGDPEHRGEREREALDVGFRARPRRRVSTTSSAT